MVAGQNISVRIWRINDSTDDYAGGAQETGTVIYSRVSARMQARPINQVFLEQGLETHKVFSAILIPGTLDIRERDELEVIQPTDHHFYNKRFSIDGVEYSDFNPRDPRSYIMLQLTRSERAHDEQ